MEKEKKKEIVKPILNSSEYELIKCAVLGQPWPVNVNKDIKYRIKKKSKSFLLINDSLYLIQSSSLHKKVITYDSIDQMTIEATKLHSLTHYGQNRLYEYCNSLFFSIKRSIVREVCNKCLTCAQAQPLKTNETYKFIMAKRPFERIIIDMIDLRTYEKDNEKYKWILTVIDVYSKFGFAFPCYTKSAIEIKDNIQRFIFQYGTPSIIQSDNGKEFTNSVFIELCNAHKIKIVHGRPRHPQSQGQVERLNQTITRYLQKFIFEENNNKNWISKLEKVIYEYNCAVHTATKKTPFELFYKRNGFNTCMIQDVDNIENSIEILEESDKNNILDNSLHEENILKIEKVPNNAYYNRINRKNVHKSIHDYKVGDIVIINLDFDNHQRHKRQKFGSFYSDPTEVISILSNNRVEVIINDENKIVNMNRLKKIN